MTRTALLLAAALSLAGLSARAESPDPSGQFAARVASGTTRAQVRAELAQALRDGDVPARGEAGLTESQLNPSAYPARVAVAGKTRAEVRAETLQAIHDGDIIGAGEAGLTVHQLFPQTYLARQRREAILAARTPAR